MYVNFLVLRVTWFKPWWQPIFKEHEWSRCLQSRVKRKVHFEQSSYFSWITSITFMSKTLFLFGVALHRRNEEPHFLLLCSILCAGSNAERGTLLYDLKILKNLEQSCHGWGLFCCLPLQNELQLSAQMRKTQQYKIDGYANKEKQCTRRIFPINAFSINMKLSRLQKSFGWTRLSGLLRSVTVFSTDSS